MVEHSELSERELQILRLVATGAGNKEIANRLSISTNTVKVHLRNIFDKIKVGTRTEAAMYAVQHGLVGESPGQLVGGSNLPDPYILASPENQNDIHTSESGTFSKPDKEKKRRRILVGILFISLVLLITFVASLLNYQNKINSEELSLDSTRWEQFPDLEDGRKGLALVVNANQLFAIAGSTVSGVTGSVSVYPFDIGVWETKNSKPTPVSDIQAVTIAGLIYVPGGGGLAGSVVDVLEIYDPAQDTWKKGEPLPEPRCRYSLVALEGMVFLFGGWDGFDYQDDAYMYNPAEDRWIELEPMTSPRAWAGGAISGGRIYVFGGINGDGISDQVYIFTPPNLNEPSGKWTEISPLPAKRYAFGATSLADLVFVVGGKGEDETALPNWIFYPELMEWRSFPSPIPPGASSQGVAGAGTHLYISGGEIDDKIQNFVYSYQAFFTASLPIVR